MKKIFKIIPREAALLVFILLIQQISLVFSYSVEKNNILIEKKVIDSLPLFSATYVDGIKVYQLNSYFNDDIDRWKARSSKLPNKITTEGIRSDRALAQFLIKHNPGVNIRQALNLAQIYIEEAGMEGINHDIAFAQMCLETGFLKFGGSVKPNQYNFCGLGATNNFEKGDSFSSVRIGIRAHIQHLKAYADHRKIKTDLVDNRFKFIARGSAQTIQDLTGKWAVDPQYGSKINRLLKNLYAF